MDITKIPQEMHHYNGWTLDQEGHTGALFFSNDSTWQTIYCSPDWEDLKGLVSIEVPDDDGGYIESFNTPYDGTLEGWFAVVKPILDKYTEKGAK